MVSFCARVTPLLDWHLLEAVKSSSIRGAEVEVLDAVRSSEQWFVGQLLPALHAAGFRPCAVRLEYIVGYMRSVALDIGRVIRYLRLPLVQNCPVLELGFLKKLDSNDPTSSDAQLELFTTLVDWLHREQEATSQRRRLGEGRVLCAFLLPQLLELLREVSSPRTPSFFTQPFSDSALPGRPETRVSGSLKT